MIKSLDTFINAVEKAVEEKIITHTKDINSSIEAMSSNISILNQNMSELLKDKEVRATQRGYDDVAYATMMTEMQQNYNFTIDKVSKLENTVDDIKRIIEARPCVADNDLYERVVRFNRAYLDTGNNIFLILDKEGKILLTNTKTCQILGRRYEDLIGITWIDNFVPEDEHPALIEAFQAALSGNIGKHSARKNKIITPTGLKSVKWQNNIIKDNGSGVIAVISIGVIDESNGRNGSQTK